MTTPWSAAKTSGSAGLHVNVRIEPSRISTEVRACARRWPAVEREVPTLATSVVEETTWRPCSSITTRGTRDRTVASAYSVRNNAEGRVSCPLEWSEVADVDPHDLTLATVPARYAAIGDPSATIDDIASLLSSRCWSSQNDEREGLGDEPWPPHFPKAKGEPTRVAPSRARKKR